MHATRPRIPVIVGIAISLAIHVTILLPLLMASFESRGRFQYLQARFDPEDFESPTTDHDEPEPEETPLGLDIDTPSTLTWVGYEEYEKHIAALAAMDQAAFTEARTAAAPSEPTQVVALEPGRGDTAPAVAEETESAEPVPERPVTAPAEIDPEQLVAMRNLLDALGRFLAEPATSEPPRPREPSEPESKSADAAESKPASPPQSGEPDVGEPSDKESDPTSVIEAPPENWRAGKPLASPGLEVQPRKPEFTILQRLSNSPRNPLCRIEFGRDGKPAEATVVESSGSSEIDAVIVSSLYRWRAKGKRLDELQPGETATVTIRIIMRD